MLGVRCEPLLNYFKRKKEDGLKTLNYNYDRHPKSLNANLALLFGHWDVCENHNVFFDVSYVLLVDDLLWSGSPDSLLPVGRLKLFISLRLDMYIYW